MKEYNLQEDYSSISLMHYSQLLNFLGPLGIIIPIVLWSSKKEHIKEMDIHGKAVINFQISLLLYSLIFFILLFISAFLTFFFIGFLLMPLLFVVGLVLILLIIIPPILGGLAASNKRFYKYPLSITFF